MAPANTLDFDADADMDLLHGVEALFGITIPDDEAAQIGTVGDLRNIVSAKVQGTVVCTLARGWQRLRGALPSKDLRRSSPLSALPGTDRKALKILGDQARLNLDVTQAAGHHFGIDDKFALPVLAAVTFGAAVRLGSLIPLALGGAAYGLWITTQRRQLPGHIQTIGDLLRAAHHLNHDNLQRPDERGNTGDIRAAIHGLCREISGHTGPITDDTTFFARYRKTERAA